jgi:S-formylglutathione hydrolase FrmB
LTAGEEVVVKVRLWTAFFVLLFSVLVSGDTASADVRLGGMSVRVLLPPAYAQGSAKAWPVLYVVPGSGCDADIAERDLQLRTWPGRQDAIVAIVSERGNDGWNYLTDYFDGSSPLDSEFIGQDLYRIERRERAIAGYSAGGYSSVEIPTQHPGVFSAVGAFSGVVDLTDKGPLGEGRVLAPNLVTDQLDGYDEALRRWGNPVTDSANWHAKNPTDHARAMRGTPVVYISAGDGVPDGDAPSVTDDPTNAIALATKVEAEEQIGEMTAAYDRALDAAHVRHVYRRHHGIHSAVDWRVDLDRFWRLAQARWGL